ncbi:MAG: hypothetical protein BWY91_03295 [bacterium ADurb.BinA028]|nr:MAG: hypothetical protein BWY91_03295 [bacterium ADurb.BinA028]
MSCAAAGPSSSAPRTTSWSPRPLTGWSSSGTARSWRRSPAPAAPGCATSSRRSRPTRTRRSGLPGAASPRSPEAPAPARPSSRCTARHTCCMPTGGVTRAAASSWSGPRRPTRHTSSGSCPPSVRTASRCAPWATSSTRCRPTGTTPRPRLRSRGRCGCASSWRGWRAACPTASPPSCAPSSPGMPCAWTRLSCNGSARTSCANTRTTSASRRPARPSPRRPCGSSVTPTATTSSAASATTSRSTHSSRPGGRNWTRARCSSG